MQSWVKTQGEVKKPLTMWGTGKMIYDNNGVRGLFRGVTPRIGLGIHVTLCMVFGGDQLKAWVAEQSSKK